LSQNKRLGMDKGKGLNTKGVTVHSSEIIQVTLHTVTCIYINTFLCRYNKGSSENVYI